MYLYTKKANRASWARSLFSMAPPMLAIFAVSKAMAPLPSGRKFKVCKKIYFAFLVKRNQFCNYLGRGFNIPEMEINFLIQNHWSVFTEDTLLNNTKVSARALNARNDQVSIRPTSNLHNFRYWCISTCLLPFLCLMEYAHWEKPKGSSTLLGLACILSDAQ